MRRILIDSSVWISYFNDSSSHLEVDTLIKNNQICTNDLVLSELIPYLKIKKLNTLIDALLEITNIKLTINWDIIINYQIINLKQGINKVGIPDLIILDHAIQNNLILYTEDKHFKLMNKFINFNLYEYRS